MHLIAQGTVTSILRVSQCMSMLENAGISWSNTRWIKIWPALLYKNCLSWWSTKISFPLCICKKTTNSHISEQTLAYAITPCWPLSQTALARWRNGVDWGVSLVKRFVEMRIEADVASITDLYRGFSVILGSVNHRNQRWAGCRCWCTERRGSIWIYNVMTSSMFSFLCPCFPTLFSTHYTSLTVKLLSFCCLQKHIPTFFENQLEKRLTCTWTCCLWRRCYC